MTERCDLHALLDHAERIGVIGSPSSTAGVALDVLASAVSKKLIGELALFSYMQDGLHHYALGQITEVRLRNIWHEDPTMRSIIRQRGRVDAVSERQDTHQAEMTISAVFSAGSGNYRPSILGTVPPTGTPIALADDEVLAELLSPYREEIFYLGRVYGSKPLLPLWFKHFDRGPKGAGEAYHLGIFGKTGSGKSVLAKMILLAYARYPGMGLLVLDPQGEFAKDAQGTGAPGGYRLPMKEVLDRLRKPVRVCSIRDLVLDRWDLFEQILYESPFFHQLSMPKGENRKSAAEALKVRLKQANVKLDELHTKEAFYKAWRLLGDETVQKTFYRADSARARFQSVYRETDPEQFYTAYWVPVTTLFSEERRGVQKVDQVLSSLFNPDQGGRPMIVIDLSAEQATRLGKSTAAPGLFGDDLPDEEGAGLLWNETIQALVMRRVLEGVRVSAERAYREERSLNTLVLIDEAHRLAPREGPENEELEKVRSILVDAARTTRKYGVGWMFISQTLSSLDRQIVEQLRIQFFGFGLGMGTELRSLSEMVGAQSKALELYQQFRDPHSSFDVASREYSFMTIGPVSPLSFAGTPLFLNAFNTPEGFLKANGLDPQTQ